MKDSVSPSPFLSGSPDRSVFWTRLRTHAASPIHMVTAFQSDPTRQQDLSWASDNLYVDFSRNLWTPEIRDDLLSLAQDCGVPEKRDSMFAGAAINTTENRAVLHMALRAGPQDSYQVAGRDVTQDIQAVLARAFDFVDAVRAGHLTGATGKTFQHVVNIGIGGSDLGPRMVTEALAPALSPPLSVHFVSNIDGSHLFDTLRSLDPERTLFVIVSKTFTTDETMTNARTARDWIESAFTKPGVRLGNSQNYSGSEIISSHFVAVSAAEQEAESFGIARERIFGFWDWVGGRTSLWSAVGLSTMLAVGSRPFQELLAGARDMDHHFRTAPLKENLPVLLGMLGLWYRNFLGATSLAILPYDQRLSRLPAYLQQADMESNGKRVRHDGTDVTYATSPVIWGAPGTNGQHAFYQMLHQGTDLIPIDFLVAARASSPYEAHHEKLVANCFAQAEALMCGQSADRIRAHMQTRTDTSSPTDPDTLTPHRVFPGNRPSTMILYPALTPFVLGQVIALYEHKIFVQGAVWGVNSYDQWGVELGKSTAQTFLPHIRDAGLPDDPEMGPAAHALLAQYHHWK